MSGLSRLFNRQVVPFALLLAVALIWSLASAQDGGGRTDKRVPHTRADLTYSYSTIVKRAAPAVVNVYVHAEARRRRSPLFDDPFFERFFGRRMPGLRQQNSLGSGVIVSPEGIVVTNNHVVGTEGRAEIKVALADGREFAATVMLKDEQTDLAVLRIENAGKDFPYLPLGDSDALEVGDIVLAIGNPFGVGQTVTSGIVSALARTRVGVSDYQFFIQTDAAINPGNSGGPLVDMNGQVAGINTAIFSKSGGSLGIGFAIPSNMVRVVVRSALRGNKVERPWLGAELQQVTPDIAEAAELDRPSGALIASVTKGSRRQEPGSGRGTSSLPSMATRRVTRNPSCTAWRRRGLADRRRSITSAGAVNARLQSRLSLRRKPCPAISSNSQGAAPSLAQPWPISPRRLPRNFPSTRPPASWWWKPSPIQWRGASDSGRAMSSSRLTARQSAAPSSLPTCCSAGHASGTSSSAAAASSGGRC